MDLTFEGKDFQKLIKNLENIEELELVFDKDGLHFMCMERGATSLFDVNINQDFFDYYHLEEDINSFFIDYDELNKVLSRSGKVTELFSCEDGLWFTFDKSRSFLLKEIDSFESRGMPQIPSEIEFSIDSKVLSDVLKDIEAVGSGTAQIKMNENNFTIVGKDSVMSDYCFSHVFANPIGTAESNFSISKLKEISKFDFISKEVTVKFGEDMPLQLIFENENMSVRSILAPIMDYS